MTASEGRGKIERIAVFGLGKLGAVVAGCHAAAGYNVVGVDVIEATLEKVKAGKPPVSETGIEELYKAARGHLTATLDGEAAARGADVSLIVVPTPCDDRGGSGCLLGRIGRGRGVCGLCRRAHDACGARA